MGVNGVTFSYSYTMHTFPDDHDDNDDNNDNDDDKSRYGDDTYTLSSLPLFPSVLI